MSDLKHTADEQVFSGNLSLDEQIERIRACVNACEGLSNDDLATLPNLINEGTGALQERDALRDALGSVIKNFKAMRDLQKQYFATRSKDVLIQSKNAERIADEIIATYLRNNQ